MLTTNMNRSAINLLGVLSFTPLLAILYLILMPFFFNGGANIAPFLIVAWLTWIGVLLLFVIFLIQSSDFLVHQKLIWIAMLFFVGVASIPIFWWIYFKSADNADRAK